MRLRTPEQLLDAISADSQQRKHELVTINGIIINARGAHKNTHCRAAILLSYAHWEGFIKTVADFYLQHISSLDLALSKLKAPFQAIASKAVIHNAGAAKTQMLPHILVIKSLVDDIGLSNFTYYKDAISTESNLKWANFLNILLALGVPETRWEAYKGFINDLVEQRCGIAHGELREISEDYAIESIKKVLCFLDMFTTDIVNAALLHDYIRTDQRQILTTLPPTL